MSKELLKKILLPIAVSVLVLLIIINLNLHSYDKYFIFPISLLSITITYILKTNDLLINKK